MERVLIGFYTVFFATGFMGGTALLLLSMRVKSRVIYPLMVIQAAFLVATGLMVAYFVAVAQPSGVTRAVEITLIVLIMLCSIAVWASVLHLTRFVAPSPIRQDPVALVSRILVYLALVAAVLELLNLVAAAAGSSVALTVRAQRAWDFGSMVAFGLGMAGFGITILRNKLTSETTAIRFLLRNYGLISLLFAPIGVIEYVVTAANIPWLSYVSLDHAFFAAWNIVSMGAAVHVFRTSGERSRLLDAIPDARIRELGLSARESEISLLIARGLTNKEIAADLGISPATVRTHIYNLYQKAGARSRVELLNVLCS